MDKDIGPAIGFVLIMLVALLILLSVGGDGRLYELAVNEVNKSFSNPTKTPGSASQYNDVFSTRSKELPRLQGSYSCVSAESPEYAELLYVVDGDTIAVRMADGAVARVRYIGVNTAEKGEEYYDIGKDLNAELVSSGSGLLVMYKDVSDTDKYGRLLRYVFSGDVFVNYELVKEGAAEALTIKPDTSCSSLFESAEHDIWR